MAIHDRDFGRELCKVLKLDPSKTRDIIIKSIVNDVVIVETTQYLQDNESKELILLLNKYQLIPKKDR